MLTLLPVNEIVNCCWLSFRCDWLCHRRIFDVLGKIIWSCSWICLNKHYLCNY